MKRDSHDCARSLFGWTQRAWVIEDGRMREEITRQDAGGFRLPVRAGANDQRGDARSGSEAG